MQSKVKARVARLKEQLEQQRAIHENGVWNHMTHFTCGLNFAFMIFYVEMKAVARRKEALDLRGVLQHMLLCVSHLSRLFSPPSGWCRMLSEQE